MSDRGLYHLYHLFRRTWKYRFYWNNDGCFFAFPFATICVKTKLSVHTRELDDTVEITKCVRVQINTWRMWWYSGGGGGGVSGYGGSDGNYDDDDNYDNGDILYQVFKDLRLAFLCIGKIISLWCHMESTVATMLSNDEYYINASRNTSYELTTVVIIDALLSNIIITYSAIHNVPCWNSPCLDHGRLPFHLFLVSTPTLIDVFL